MVYLLFVSFDAITHTHTHLPWLNDVVALYGVVCVAAAVILGVPLAAPLAGHAGDTPENTNIVRCKAYVCVSGVCVSVCVFVRLTVCSGSS